MEAKLIPINGGEEPFVITADLTLVGRKRGLCDLIVERGSVSKLHCVIVKTDGLLFIRDLGSTNGTKVNGQRVTRGALLPGDELAFASAKFRVHLGPGEPEVGPGDRTEMLSGAFDPSPVYRHDVPPEDDHMEGSEEGDFLNSDDGDFVEDDEAQPYAADVPPQISGNEPRAGDDSLSDVRLLSEDELDS
ncbi:MAG: FHA domain-containing protein [Planctomycetes bacterium]|nr:FHA domain-containing protein [Planctomycetota bacterium]